MDGFKRHWCSAIVLLLVTVWLPSRVSARGRMMEPPQRSSLYSRGFNSPPNDDDSALNCGGPWRQHELNGGKCGVCGDPYDAIVRENEAGGKFANGIIANTYTTNDSSVPVVIDIQSFLKGYFEFRICPHNNIEVTVDQMCLDRYPLRVWDFEDNQPRYRYYPKGVGLQRLRVELPRGMTCSQCVLQWKWHTGNNWGRCKDGLYKIGCGPQETYINCADVAIVPANDLEYKHFFPELPKVPAAASNPSIGNNNPAYSGALPWASVSFVSHNTKTVVELRNTSNTAESPIVSNYNVGSGSVQSLPGSFLPKEVIEVRPEEPVQPKFDFYDPSKTTTTVINEVKTPETRTEAIVTLDLDKQITTIDTSSSFKPKKDVVVLPYNGVSSETLYHSSALDVATYPSVLDNTTNQDSVTNTDGLKTESASESVVIGNSRVPSTGMVTTSAFDKTTDPKPTVPSIAASSTDGTTKQATTRNFDIRTFTGINITTPNTTDNLEISTKQNTASSVANIQESKTEIVTEPVNKETTSVHSITTSATITGEERTETPVQPVKPRSTMKTLSRHTRQAGPKGRPPPPPPQGSGTVGAAPMKQEPRPDPSPSGMYDPSRSAGTLAQKDVIIQQQLSSGNTMSSASSITSNLGQEMTGVEALGEPGGPLGLQDGVTVKPSYPGAAVQYSQQTGGPGQSPQAMSSGPQQDPRMGPMPGGPDPGPGLVGDPSADSGVPYEKPRIPRPPEVSAAEIEAAIADTPVISSAVSDTGKSMDASSILGTSYIPGLNEAASNLAETSTASRQGTMIVHAELSSPADRGKTGGSVEYLSPTQGTSASDKPSETQAQIPATKFSASLGFMPTPEQIMSGMRGMTRPVPTDTTNLEPTGPDPNVQNVQEAKEALIRQLGAAMGIIPGGTQQPVPEAPPAQTANIVPDQNIATVLAMAGLSSQSSAGPIASSAETMAANQMQQPIQTVQMDRSMTMSSGQVDQSSQTLVSDASQSNKAMQSAIEQAVFPQTGDQTQATGTEAVPGLMGRLAGQMGNMSPEVMQLLAQAQSAGIDPRIMLASLSQGPAQFSIAPGTAIQGGDGMLSIKIKGNSGTQMQTKANTEKVAMVADGQAGGRIFMGPDMMIPGSEVPVSPPGQGPRMPVGPDMILPPSKIHSPQPGGSDPRISFGPDMMIPGAEVPVPGPKSPVGQDVMPQPSAETTVQFQQTPTQTFSEPAVPQNVIGDKATDLSTSGANMFMDQTMMQNLMQMRLSPEMVNYIKFGVQGVDMTGSGEMGVIDNLFKQNMGMQPTAGKQPANTDAMSSKPNQAVITAIDMTDMGRSSGASQVSQSGMEQSARNQAVITNPVEIRSTSSQMLAGVARQQGMTAEQRAQMQAGMTVQQINTAEQQMVNLASQQSQQASEPESAPVATAANNKQQDLMMTMGRLFGGNAGPLGGGLMGGTTKADMSGVQYETANKVTGQADVSANQAGVKQAGTTLQQTDTTSSQMSTGTKTSGAEQSSATTNAGFGQRAMFAGLNNQLISQFGFGSMNQGADQSAVMSEVVSGTGDTMTGQQTGSAQAGISDVSVGAMDASANVQLSEDLAAQKAVDFTPIGSIGSFMSVADGSSIRPKVEQQWSWDPTTQAWVLVAASDAQAQVQATDSAVPNQVQTQAAADSASQAQTQADMATSQETAVQGTVEQQAVATDVTAVNQQATDMSKDQAGQVGAGRQVMGQSDQTNWVGYQWDAASNSYIPIQSAEQTQPQVSATASQVMDTQSAVDTFATQVTISDVSTGMQQADSQVQTQVTGGTTSQAAMAMQGQGSADVSGVVSGQETGQVGQTWEQAGYTWDAATNAYVPTGILQQSVAESSRVAATSKAAAAVDQTSAQSLTSVDSAAVDMSASGNMQIAGSVEITAGGSSVEQQPASQVQTAVFKQPNQIESQPIPEAKTTLYQAPDQGITPKESSLLDMSGTQSTDTSGTQSSVRASQVSGQQQEAAAASVQQAAQQGFQQVDFTQWAQQQQQAGMLSTQGTMQAEQQQQQGQDAGFQAVQKPDLSQRSSAFDVSAQQALLAEERSKNFQQSPQLTTKSSAGPLMLETQPWEQPGTAQQVIQQQVAQQQQMSVTGASSGQVSQVSKQTDPTAMGQASQQQWNQGAVQGSVAQVDQQVFQETGIIDTMQPSTQPQTAQGPVQMAQYTQQQLQAGQTMNAQAPQYQTAQQGETSAGPIGMAVQQGQTSAGPIAMSADAMATGQVHQTGSATAQSTGIQTWNQNMQVQNGVQGTQMSTTGTQTDTSFTPIGEIGSGSDATAKAWHALLAAAQAEVHKSVGTQPPQAGTPVVSGQTTAQQTTSQQASAQQPIAQQTTNQQTTGQTQQTMSWEEVVKAAMAHQAANAKQQQATHNEPAKPQVPAWATGLQTQQSSQAQQVSQRQAVQQQMSAAKPPPTQRPRPEPERKVPIRPDPVTRAFVRDMFVKQMAQGPDVNPLHILIGLNPELLMKSGVNPRIARSGDVSQIVPAVERALGISLRRRRGRGRGGGGPPPSIGGAFADPMGGPRGMDFGGTGPEPMGGRRRGSRPVSARDRAMQRRKFMMEQRMITEVMGLLGLGPEPLEPGDPGYRGPGQRARGGAAARMGGMGPGGPSMGGGVGGGAMPGMPGAGGPAATNPQSTMLMEMLGL